MMIYFKRIATSKICPVDTAKPTILLYTSKYWLTYYKISIDNHSGTLKKLVKILKLSKYKRQN